MNTFMRWWKKEHRKEGEGENQRQTRTIYICYLGKGRVLYFLLSNLYCMSLLLPGFNHKRV